VYCTELNLCGGVMCTELSRILYGKLNLYGSVAWWCRMVVCTELSMILYGRAEFVPCMVVCTELGRILYVL
jgi:hypothetical protein